jgi:uncharacterized protein (DUF2235 family)
MAKNIVLCCDGTGNEFGDANSNVERLYSVLRLDDGRQVAYYHPGVGTMGAPNALLKISQWWTRMLGMIFGYGLTAMCEDAYIYLMEAFEPGDAVFVFGFSRGAYTARTVCSMLRMYGLVRQGDEALVRYISRMLRHGQDPPPRPGEPPPPNRFQLAAQFKSTFSRPCRPHFVGVWDTVSSVGWIYNPVRLPYTAKNEDIRIARHAISIDERRGFYRPNLWQPLDPKYGQDLKQVWFAGVHSDVGGSYPEATGQLSKIALQWMLREACAAGLRVDPYKVECVLGRNPADRACKAFVAPDAAADAHDSLKGLWRLLELVPKRVNIEVEQPDGTVKWVKKWKLPLGERRRIDPGSLVHQSVEERMARRQDYRPKNLPPKPDYQVVQDLPAEVCEGGGAGEIAP